MIFIDQEERQGLLGQKAAGMYCACTRTCRKAVAKTFLDVLRVRSIMGQIAFSYHGENILIRLLQGRVLH
ncbi:hypothetical protein I7I50_10560 [Histoplasma capsulatum G186AR]|uniref:Uncharacterized protein n=1 Tax=Ajellomyces capsulatus TaxID=5037 RepID=A0A8H7Z6X4_AJECA|nr:hypothetical protein I7I52_01799 [Histoplasma capsulatum]QSS69312.1 hypothetical protein I7I50_10560 [Histoplasma capsulatum G186AR]